VAYSAESNCSTSVSTEFCIKNPQRVTRTTGHELGDLRQPIIQEDPSVSGRNPLHVHITDHSDLADMSCTFLEFHGVLDIAPAAKIRSAGDNVNESTRTRQEAIQGTTGGASPNIVDGHDLPGILLLLR
jgi:hypothetical protein